MNSSARVTPIVIIAGVRFARKSPSPPVCESSIPTVTLVRTVTSGYPGKNRPTTSSNDSFPRSTSWPTATAVNILPIDPRVNRVDGVIAVLRARSA